MPYAIQQSTTAFPLVFLMVQSSDHITGLTGASPTVTLSKSGAAFGSPSGAVSEIANGWYKVAGNATDTNTLGPLILHATAASGDPTDMVFEVVAYNPQDGVHFGLSCLPNTAVTGNASLITSGSGTDQLTVSGGIASADVKKWNGTTVATPATAGIPDINVKNINNVAAATPGASGGILISGSNSGTTTLGALTVTGATTMTGGLAVSAGATIAGSANGAGLTISGGGTSGAGLVINTTSGDGVQVSPTAGHGINIAANGTSKHGITSTGGTAGTSDGIKGVAGTGGVDIRGNITGNITGNLTGTVSTLTTYTGNTPQTGDAFARLGAPAGASVSADIAAIKSDTGTINGNVDAAVSSRATPAQILTTALTESYSSLHGTQTLSQILFEMRGHLCEKSVNSTTLTTKKLDGSTTAETFTLNDAVSPTSITRAT